MNSIKVSHSNSDSTFARAWSRAWVQTSVLIAVAIAAGLGASIESHAADRIGNGGDLAFAELYNAVVPEAMTASYPPTTAFEALQQIFASAQPYQLPNPPQKLELLAGVGYNSQSMNDYQVMPRPDLIKSSFYIGYNDLGSSEMTDLGLPIKQELIAPNFTRTPFDSNEFQIEYQNGTPVVYSLKGYRREFHLRKIDLIKGKMRKEFLIGALVVIEQETNYLKKATFTLNLSTNFLTIDSPMGLQSISEERFIRTNTYQDASTFFIFRVVDNK